MLFLTRRPFLLPSPRHIFPLPPLLPPTTSKTPPSFLSHPPPFFPVAPGCPYPLKPGDSKKGRSIIITGHNCHSPVGNTLLISVSALLRANQPTNQPSEPPELIRGKETNKAKGGRKQTNRQERTGQDGTEGVNERGEMQNGNEDDNHNGHSTTPSFWFLFGISVTFFLLLGIVFLTPSRRWFLVQAKSSWSSPSSGWTRRFPGPYLTGNWRCPGSDTVGELPGPLF